jgi:protein-S-isoprenylcysteine O-methyltransferase Ste14
MVRIAIFALASAGIVFISWRSLASPRSHGFYRCFAFEFLAALILWNVSHWFRDPFSLRQLISWFLLIASASLAIEGFRLLRVIGKPARQAAQSTDLAFESTTTLVTVGAYRWIRHPLYASLLGLVWGACLKQPVTVSIALALAASAFLLATALAEERENLARFGAAYAAYKQSTRRFIPWVF